MRDIEQQRIALECLKLAQDGSGDAGGIVTRAEAFYAFVTGSENANAKLAAVRDAVR